VNAIKLSKVLTASGLAKTKSMRRNTYMYVHIRQCILCSDLHVCTERHIQRCMPFKYAGQSQPEIWQKLVGSSI